jgi:hypothetical protein
MAVLITFFFLKKKGAILIDSQTIFFGTLGMLLIEAPLSTRVAK